MSAHAALLGSTTTRARARDGDKALPLGSSECGGGGGAGLVEKAGGRWLLLEAGRPRWDGPGKPGLGGDVQRGICSARRNPKR